MTPRPGGQHVKEIRIDRIRDDAPDAREAVLGAAGPGGVALGAGDGRARGAGFPY
jgi:hypothetical protein